MLRIVGGAFRGTKIKTAKGTGVRPTLAKTRETIFNVLNSHINLSDYEVADLFAGSGALGIEALSRGAHKGTLVEKNRTHFSVLKSTIKQLRLEDRCTLHCMDGIQWLKRTDWKERSVVFLIDPPYDAKLYQKVVDSICLFKSQFRDCILVLEAPKNEEISYTSDLTLFQQKKSGITRIDFLTLTNESKDEESGAV